VQDAKESINAKGIWVRTNRVTLENTLERGINDPTSIS
jgi:hypothetical protein